MLGSSCVEPAGAANVDGSARAGGGGEDSARSKRFSTEAREAEQEIMPLLNGRKLQGAELGELNDAIRDAFPIPNSLQMVMRQRLDKALYDYVAPGAEDYKILVHQLLVQAEAESFTAELVQAARFSRPANLRLVQFVEQFGLVPVPDESPDVPGGRSLERLIQPDLYDLDIAVFREQIGQVEGRVARVEAPTSGGTLWGTGFLLGADVFITNHHVLEALIRSAEGNAGAVTGRSKDVRIRFDYKVLPNGVVVSEGTTFALAADWLLDHSPYSAMDLSADAAQPPDPNELDYALVRLAAPAGNLKLGGEVADRDAPARGWLSPKLGADTDFAPGRPLFIVQHPQGRPLKLTPGFQSMIGLNANKTRVRYRTNTAGGSSGSPCFNERLELLALHHSGDPNFDRLYTPKYNQGVPFAAIVGLLQKRGKGGLLG